VDGWWAASYLVLWLLVLAMAAVTVALARQIGTLHMRLGPRGALEIDDEGPPLGEAPQPIKTIDTSSAPVTIGGPGEAQLLMFVSPTCQMCRDVLPALPAVAEAAHLVPYVVSEGEASLELEVARLRARVVVEKQANTLYAIPGTPYVVVLDDAGIVRAKGTVNNLEQMEGLVDTAAKRAQGTPEHREASG
jgi:methylamine dehydrogenase accessory protein MauD